VQQVEPNKVSLDKQGAASSKWMEKYAINEIQNQYYLSFLGKTNGQFNKESLTKKVLKNS
jgi:hypothetical protein